MVYISMRKTLSELLIYNDISYCIWQYTHLVNQLNTMKYCKKYSPCAQIWYI